MNKNLIERSLQPTELMIKKMETLTEAWRKPWIADLAHGLPRNLRGTPYRGGNILMLLFLSEIAGYSTPLFMTFKQAKEEGLNILKGSGSFPVFSLGNCISAIRRPARRLSWRTITACRRSSGGNTTLPVMRYYPVFNIDQTDMSGTAAEGYASLTTPAGPKDYRTVWTCEVLDRTRRSSRGSVPSCSDPQQGVLFADARPISSPWQKTVATTFSGWVNCRLATSSMAMNPRNSG